MAVLSLNTNLSSLKTQRKLAESTSALSKTYERLSSGLRVSRAADDAAGLAIASGLNVDSRVFSQGLRNLSDGVSVTNIAEGALNELTNIVLRLQELAEQAANGTLGMKQRSSLDAEAQALSKEYFRIAKTTEFNGRKLFDGDIQGLSLQAGYGADGALQSSLGGMMGTGTFKAGITSGTGANPRFVDLGDLNGDGVLDIVSSNVGSATASVLLGNGDGTFKAKTDFEIGAGPYSVDLGDLNGDGVLDIVSANSGSATASVLLGNGDGTFRAKTDFGVGASPHSVALGDLNGDGILDIASANYSGLSASVLLGNGDGTFKAKTDFGTGNRPISIALGDLNGDGVLDIVSANYNNVATASVSVLLGNGDGTFKAKANFGTGSYPYGVALGDLNGDGVLDIVSANYGGDSASVLLGNGDGTFKAKTDLATANGTQSVSLGDLNGDGVLDIVAANFMAASGSVFLGNGNGTFQAKTTLDTGGRPYTATLGDLNRDGVLDIVAANFDNNAASVHLGNIRHGVGPLLDFSLKTKADAKWALELMKQKLTQLSQQRGIIGANQSRISTAIANLQVERENYDAASSQITDVDVASESATLVRTQILQQGAAAILGQANQAPALALQLLSR